MLVANKQNMLDKLIAMSIEDQIYPDYICLPIMVLRPELVGRMNIPRLCSHYKLSEQFMQANTSWIDWETVCREQSLSEPFMELNAERMVWPYISVYQTLSESFMSKYWTRLSANYICSHQRLSAEFILGHIGENNQSLLNLAILCQDLPEAFITKYGAHDYNKIQSITDTDKPDYPGPALSSFLV